MDCRRPRGTGRVPRRAAQCAHAQGHLQPGRLRRGLRLGIRKTHARRREKHRRGPRFSGQSHFARLDRLGQGVCLGAGTGRAENAGHLHRRRHSHHAAMPIRSNSANACAGCTKAKTATRSTPSRSAAVSSRSWSRPSPRWAADRCGKSPASMRPQAVAARIARGNHPAGTEKSQSRIHGTAHRPGLSRGTAEYRRRLAADRPGPLSARGRAISRAK